MRTSWTIGAILAIAAPALAQDAPRHHVLAGTVGPYRVGADIAVASDHKTVLSASYFYASKGVDIPLKADSAGDGVTLTEPGGGTFTLRFHGNGSAKPPLDSYTSTALVGTWRGAGKSYPVTLDFDFEPPDRAGQRWYADVTDASDAQFEALVRRFLTAVVSGDKAMAANAVSYPLTVNGRQTLHIANRAQLLQHWGQIFTPDYVATLKKVIWHKMFVRDGLAMVAAGEIWFDGKGAHSLNPGG